MSWFSRFVEFVRAPRDGGGKESPETQLAEVEKTLKENEDKVSEGVKTEIREALDEAKKVLQDGDIAAINSAAERLERVSHRMAEEIYKTGAAAGAGAQAPGDAPSGGQQATDDVIDAEVVDSDEKN